MSLTPLEQELLSVLRGVKEMHIGCSPGDEQCTACEAVTAAISKAEANE